MEQRPAASASTAAPDGAVVLLREAWVKRVAAFIASAGTEEEARLDGRPEVIFSKIDQTGLPMHYSDFNVRSRHLRCLESFFVAIDGAGEIDAVVGIDGLRSDKRICNVNLVIVRPRPEAPASRLHALLDGVLQEAGRFAPVVKLRLTYIYDHSFAAPLGAHVARTLIEASETVGLVEEARIANETGPGREAVLLGFLRPAAA